MWRRGTGGEEKKGENVHIRACVCAVCARVCEGFQRRIQFELEITQVTCELQAEYGVEMPKP